MDMTFARIGVLALGVAATPAASHAQEQTTVRMALAGGSLIAAIPKMVEDLGYFDNHGIDATFVSMDSSSAAATALMSGSADVAFSGPGSLVAAQARGQDLVAINSTYRGLGGTLVLSAEAAEASGIDPTADVSERLAALDGLNIATPSATSTYTMTYKAAAEQAGSAPNFTYMSIPTMPAALANGAVDGYVASAPFWLAPVIDGSGVEWISGPRGELPQEFAPAHTAVTIVTRDFVTNHAATIDSVNAAFNDFIAALDSDPDKIKAEIAKNFPDLTKESIDRLFESELQAWKAGAITEEEIAHEVEFALSSSNQIPAQVRDVPPGQMIYKH